MTNFDRARNRIMYSQNLLDTYTISINKKQIKKTKTNKNEIILYLDIKSRIIIEDYTSSNPFVKAFV